MGSNDDQYKLALVSYIELVLMRKGNVNYHLVMAKLGALYNCKIDDCYEHPEYLKAILQDVYKEEHVSMISQIKSYLGDLVEARQLVDFFKKMES